MVETQTFTMEKAEVDWDALKRAVDSIAEQAKRNEGDEAKAQDETGAAPPNMEEGVAKAIEKGDSFLAIVDGCIELVTPVSLVNVKFRVGCKAATLATGPDGWEAHCGCGIVDPLTPSMFRAAERVIDDKGREVKLILTNEDLPKRVCDVNGVVWTREEGSMYALSGKVCNELHAVAWLYGPLEIEEGIDSVEYAAVVEETAIYPDAGEQTREAITYTIVGLTGEVGELADKYKKVIRGDVPLREQRDAMAHELGDVLWYVHRVAAEMGYSIEEIQAMNAKKLLDRKKRGALQGSGDNR